MLLGDELRDKITGFRGTATAFVSYLEGSQMFLLEAKVVDPSLEPLHQWCITNRLEKVL